MICLFAVFAFQQQAKLSADTEQPRVKLGPRANGLRVGPGMNAVGTELRGTEIVGQNLSGSIFDRCNLDGVRIYQCDLSNASFKSAKLTGATIDDCKIDSADFSDAVINGWLPIYRGGMTMLTPDQLKTTRSYRTKDLSRCSITAAARNKQNRRIRCEYDFSNANLENADLFGGDFRDSDFTNAKVTGLRISGCKFAFRQLASTLSYREKSLRNLDLSVTFDGPESPDFSDVDLTNTRFSSRFRPDAIFADAKISGCAFQKSISFTQIAATKNFKQRDLTGIRFSRLNLANGDFSNVDLSGAYFNYCDLTNAKFNDAIVTGSWFDSCSGLTESQIKSTWNFKNGRVHQIKQLPGELADIVKSAVE